MPAGWRCFVRAAFGSSHRHPAAPSLSTAILPCFVQITRGSLTDDTEGALLPGGPEPPGLREDCWVGSWGRKRLTGGASYLVFYLPH